MKSRREPDLELPIAFVPCSNGEMPPPAPTERDRKAIELYVRIADENAKRMGLSRRDFVRSACGMATALGVMNLAYGCGSDESGTGGGYVLPPEAGVDPATCEKLTGDEFVFDVQVHHVDPNGKWRENAQIESALNFPYTSCGEADRIACLGVEHFLREVYVKSDTAVACLTGLPIAPEMDPLPLEQRIQTQAIVERLSGSQRLLLHANVLPERKNQAFDAMQAAVERYGKRIAAWKAYPSTGKWRFDDPAVGVPFIEKARALGVKIICAHRGIAGDDGSYGADSSPREMFKMAQAYPDIAFLAYHSGWESTVPEGPYDAANPRGIDRMVKAMEEFPATNVYAELGSTFRGLMTKPIELAHALGKLLKALGEDRVLWGTDCIWYGSPAEQLAAFRAFEIPQALQEAHGYPALTKELKRKVLGLNGAKVYGVDPAAVRCVIRDDDIAKLKTASLDAPPAPLRDYGPRTRRELMAMLRLGLG